MDGSGPGSAQPPTVTQKPAGAFGKGRGPNKSPFITYVPNDARRLLGSQLRLPFAYLDPSAMRGCRSQPMHCTKSSGTTTLPFFFFFFLFSRAGGEILVLIPSHPLSGEMWGFVSSFPKSPETQISTSLERKQSWRSDLFWRRWSNPCPSA